MTDKEIINDIGCCLMHDCNNCLHNDFAECEKELLNSALSALKAQNEELALITAYRDKLEVENTMLRETAAIDCGLEKLIGALNAVIREAVEYGDRAELGDMATVMEELLNLIDKNKTYHIAFTRCRFVPCFETNNNIKIRGGQ